MDCQSCAESCCTLLQDGCGDTVPCCLHPRYNMTADEALQLRARSKAKVLFIVEATLFYPYLQRLLPMVHTGP